MNELKSVVDLKFELLREPVVGYTNESTAYLYDFALAKLWSKVKYVLETEGGIRSDLDVTVHNRCLCHLNEAFNTLWES